MGRADRGQNPVGEYKYEVFLSFDDVMNLLLRIFQTSVKYVRDLELKEFYDVLQLMVLPTRCCHVVMENWFEKTNMRQRHGTIRVTMCFKMFLL